jgi:hypothetical protein
MREKKWTEMDSSRMGLNINSYFPLGKASGRFREMRRLNQ